jgi:hypothetical protein
LIIDLKKIKFPNFFKKFIFFYMELDFRLIFFFLILIISYLIGIYLFFFTVNSPSLIIKIYLQGDPSV